MTDDPLKQLLRRADVQNEPVLASSEEMARRVKGLSQRQDRQRAVMLVLGAPVALLIAGAVMFGAFAWRPTSQAPLQVADRTAIAPPAENVIPAVDSQVVRMTPGEAHQALAEIAALQAEADFHFQVARRMIAERERDATLALGRQALTEDEPAEVVRERLDLVAYRMISRADRLRNEPRPNEDPTEIYREVVRLFPTTPSAAEARLRLAELDLTQPPGGA